MKKGHRINIYLNSDLHFEAKKIAQEMNGNFSKLVAASLQYVFSHSKRVKEVRDILGLPNP